MAKNNLSGGSLSGSEQLATANGAGSSPAPTTILKKNKKLKAQLRKLDKQIGELDKQLRYSLVYITFDSCPQKMNALGQVAKRFKLDTKRREVRRQLKNSYAQIHRPSTSI